MPTYVRFHTCKREVPVQLYLADTMSAGELLAKILKVDFAVPSSMIKKNSYIMCINTVCIMSVLLVNYTLYCVHTQVEGTTYLYT